MKPRFYVRQGINAWLVLDHLRIPMHDDVVARLSSRREARAKAKELNDETKQDRRADEQLTVDGETI